MDSFKDSVAFWATVVGTLTGVFGLFESHAWIAVIGALIATCSIGALIYAARQRALVRSASVNIGSRSIDSLNLASLNRRLNRSLVIQETENLAIIDGEDLAVTWKCSGYCRADRETALEFSIDADANIPFDAMECVGFDLRRDPRRLHPIRPVLVGPDGISKKIAVPFLAPMSHREPFSVELTYRLPSCLKTGTDYYTATLSFAQDTIPRFSVRLRFLRGAPQWVRSYECRIAGTATLLRNLRPVTGTRDACEYLDSDENVPARCARVYMFSRPALLIKKGTTPVRAVTGGVRASSCNELNRSHWHRLRLSRPERRRERCHSSFHTSRIFVAPDIPNVPERSTGRVCFNE